MSTKYDTDFYAWTIEEAAKLRAGSVQDLDLAHLAEEIESMGKSDRRKMFGHLRKLLQHLLKWEYQPSARSKSWEATIRVQRGSVLELIEDSPSLRNKIPDGINRAYADAVALAIGETGLAESVFPHECAYPVEQILDESFFPESKLPVRTVSIHRSPRR